MKKWGIVLGAVVAVGLIASVLVGGALAQGPTTQAKATPQASQPKARPADGMSDIATLLGMTLDEIRAERIEGKTLADLAKEKGVDTQKLVDALVAGQKTLLDQAVTDGRVTQAQADKWLAWYAQSAALQLTEPYVPGLGMRGGPGGPGGRGGPGGPGAPGGVRGQAPTGQDGDTPPQAPTQ